MVRVVGLVLAVVLGCTELGLASDPTEYVLAAGVVCRDIETFGHLSLPWEGGEAPLDERAEAWNRAVDGYGAWQSMAQPAGTDARATAARAEFEQAWPNVAEEAFDVAFRCRRMVAILRDQFGVTRRLPLPTG